MGIEEKMYHSLLGAGVVTASSVLGVLGGTYLLEHKIRRDFLIQSEYFQSLLPYALQGTGLALGAGVGIILATVVLHDEKE